MTANCIGTKNPSQNYLPSQRPTFLGWVEKAKAALSVTFETLVIWNSRIATRRELAGLPDYLRRDMGLSESQVYEEVSKPFWVA